MNDIEYVDGLSVKQPSEKAPDFIKCTASINREKMIAFLNKKGQDWVNFDIKVSKSGNWFAAVNNWKPTKQDVQQVRDAIQSDNFYDDPPF